MYDLIILGGGPAGYNAAERAGFVEVVRTAGLDQLHIIKELSFLECVQLYYEKLS